MSGHLLGPGDNSDKDQARGGRKVAERPGKPLGLLDKGPAMLCPSAEAREPVGRAGRRLWGPCSGPRPGDARLGAGAAAEGQPRAPQGWSVEGRWRGSQAVGAAGRAAPVFSPSSSRATGLRGRKPETQRVLLALSPVGLWAPGRGILGEQGGCWPALESCLAVLK